MARGALPETGLPRRRALVVAPDAASVERVDVALCKERARRVHPHVLRVAGVAGLRGVAVPHLGLPVALRAGAVPAELRHVLSVVEGREVEGLDEIVVEPATAEETSEN